MTLGLERPTEAGTYRPVERASRARYVGPVWIRGPDGVLWDVASGELEANPSPAVPTVGWIRVASGAALSSWAGPVLLEPGESRPMIRAILTPAGSLDGWATLKVTGLSPPTWEGSSGEV